MVFIWSNVIIFFILFQCSSLYRLNVPRVLLPYHPTIPVKFLLEVSQPSGGCFKWRSTRPDVVSVTPIGINHDECSDKAEIRSTAKVVSGELSAVIFAEDSGQSREFAFSVGDKFSTLSEIAIEWEISNTGDGRPLRIVPFEQSTYEAPNEIIELENRRKKGYIILVEGILTGSATITAKFSEAPYSNINAYSLDLTVVANLLLLPAHDLYVPLKSHILQPFQEVQMPSSDYYLKLDSEIICKLDKTSSSIHALTRGRTDIHLLSYNVDVKTKTGVRPPSTAIHVVDPDTLQWIISGGGKWLLQIGTRYQLSVSLFDPHGNAMYISDNLRFDNNIPETYFDVHFMSKNQTYFEVTPKKMGKTILKSKFVAVVDEMGNVHDATGKVTGEQTVQIVHPVKISPSEVVFPYIPRRKTSYMLKASGGSGFYDWSVADTSVCSVDPNGLLSAASPGVTVVTVSDKRNPVHKDSIRVSVLDVVSLTFGETLKEAEVGSDLIINVQLLGSNSSELVPFTDCRAADFRVQSSNNEVFTHVPDFVPKLPVLGTGCSTIMLRAISSNDAKITVSFDHLEAVLHVSSYLPLKVSFFHRRGLFCIAPTECIYFQVVRLEIGNKPSVQLPLPVVSRKNVSVCCAHPTRLVILPLIENQPKCSSNVRMLLTGSSLEVTLGAYGSCSTGIDSVLESISGFTTKWKSSNKDAMGIDNVGRNTSSHDTKCLTECFVASVIVKSHNVVGLVTISAEMSVEGRSRSEKPIKAISLRKGSGHFRIVERPDAPFTAVIKGDTVTVTPRSRGAGSLRIEDVCVNMGYTDVAVKITDIHSLVLYGPSFMEVGTEAEVSVDAVDEDGISFSRNHGNLSNAIVDTSDTDVHISRINSTSYRIRALSVGGVILSASARSTSGRTLTSRPHTIQVFSPLMLLPQKITLIPGSTFQLEVVGGPQPSPPIEFALNNSEIAHVDQNALITSKNVGYTSIMGSMKIGVEHSIQNAVALQVVSLAGVLVIATTHVAERGARLWVRLNGLDESETPFSFGGAIHPFKVTWSVSHPNVLKMVHPFGSSISETDENRFSVCLEGSSVGTALVKVRVEMSPLAKEHFAGHFRVFEDSINIRVEEPLEIHKSPISAVRISQDSQIHLETTWPQSSVEFSVPSEFSNRLFVSKSGLVQAKSFLGPAAVLIRRIDSSQNETYIIPITVSAVHSMDLILLSKISPLSSTPLLHLPVGVRLMIQVVFRDSYGRLLNAASSSISYRPHRFDLTEIVASNSNRTFTITMKTAGETVLQIWNTDDQSQNIFLRLSASEQLYPLDRPPTVSDIVCFTSPIEGTMRWSSNDDRIEWLDVEHGVGKLVKVGRTHVTVNVAEQMLTSSITISAVQKLIFADEIPNFITNAEGLSYIFPVNIVANETHHISHVAMTGCTESQLEALSSVRAPFECSATFLGSKIGSYACFVERQQAGNARLDITAATKLDLSITAKWLGNFQVSDAELNIVFHMAMHVVESQIQLSDVDQKSAVLSVHVPSYQLRYVTAVGCAADIVTVSDIRKPTGLNTAANKFFSVKLNIKSAALWSELSEKCLVTIENSLTGQSIHIPVRVRIVGQAAKQVYKALDSVGLVDFILIFLQHYPWLIPSLMWFCAVGIITIAVYWYIRRSVWEREGTFNYNSTLRSPVSSTPALSGASVSMQSSPSFFRNSPLGKSTPIFGESIITSPKQQRHAGARGEPTLWSSGMTGSDEKVSSYYDR
ncbi:bacterial group 2 Ig-like protein [Dictyocaulus viviparus]|uniref:Bacterial group 2 Ig-like protein n=1 Tax=Dictyocaulus viviparus TaxID=29172 RepID=A0A0D8XP24_DICVI|nr:bacterial group 2 Ig-like protein [Dictyocaulus viviparus]